VRASVQKLRSEHTWCADGVRCPEVHARSVRFKEMPIGSIGNVNPLVAGSVVIGHAGVEPRAQLLMRRLPRWPANLCELQAIENGGASTGRVRDGTSFRGP
jgi:hypothetical protein